MLIPQSFDLLEQRADIHTRTLGHADFLRAPVALCLQFLGLHLQGLALLLEFLKARGVEDEAAAGKRGGDPIEVGADQFGIKHGFFFTRRRNDWSGRFQAQTQT